MTTHAISERRLGPTPSVALYCSCGWRALAHHRNALARASKIRSLRDNHLNPPSRKVVEHESTLPSGRVLKTRSVRCPGSCGGWAGFERLPGDERRAKLNGHGGGRLGLASCSWCGYEVVLDEEPQP